MRIASIHVRAITSINVKGTPDVREEEVHIHRNEQKQWSVQRMSEAPGAMQHVFPGELALMTALQQFVSEWNGKHGQGR